MNEDNCKYYDGSKLLHPKRIGLCKGGVDVRALVGGESFGWITRAPCNSGNQCLTPCDKFTAFTPEEIEQKRLDREELTKHMKIVIPFSSKLKQQHPKGYSGETLCPLCANKFRFRIAASNGHFHGMCETPNCCSVME